MNKFQKRITKSMRKNLQDAIVIGHGFGMLEEILETFNTVFILNGPDDIKRRNLINRTSVESLYGLYTVGAMFIDLDQVNLLSKDLESVLKSKPYTEGGVSYFKFKDFWRFVIRSKSWADKTYPKNKTIRLLEDLFKARQEVKKITEKSVKVWAVEKISVEKYVPVKKEKEKAPFE